MPLQYIWGRDAEVADWVARSKRDSGFNVYAGFTDKKLKAIGIADAASGELIAGIVYFNWKPKNETIEMSVEATPGHHWLTRTTLALMFQYPFIVCRCQMLIAQTSGNAVHVQRMLASLNFSLIRVPRAGGRNEDGVIALLTVEDWIAGKFCQKLGHHLVVEPPAEKVA